MQISNQNQSFRNTDFEANKYVKVFKLETDQNIP